MESGSFGVFIRHALSLYRGHSVPELFHDFFFCSKRKRGCMILTSSNAESHLEL